MQSSYLQFLPLAPIFYFGLVFILILVFAFVQVGVLSYAYEKVGVHRYYVFSLLLVSLLGSYVNIPVAEVPAKQIVSGQLIEFFGMQYVVPVVQDWPRTVIAVNVGGAVVPVLLSLYLIVRNRLGVNALLAVVFVAAVVHRLAQPVRGLGVAVPTLLPPLAAALTAWVLGRRSAPALAYVAGSLGTLIGADLMNLDVIQSLGAPVASIGGAGTFDGIFLTGIIAVLLA